MTSPVGCDGCHDEVDLFAVSNRDTGQAQFLGPLCLALFGATMLIGASTDVADSAFKELGYQPTAATKKARKDAGGPDYPATESIIDVVESEPRPPGEETEDECPECGGMFTADGMIEHVERGGHDEPSAGEVLVDAVIERVRADDPSDPAPY